MTQFTVDELAHEAAIPVRTIREYQTIGLLPPPERRGRVGVYGTAHLHRLQLIARLQERGYSLAGIDDLLTSWRDGADLAEVLGLEPDQLVHIDEPGARATRAQLAELLPSLVPRRLPDLESIGLLERVGEGEWCVTSPSLLQLTADALDAGVAPKDVVALLRVVGQATDAIADAAATALRRSQPTVAPARLRSLRVKGRGLLAHGTGRLTIWKVGRRL